MRAVGSFLAVLMSPKIRGEQGMSNDEKDIWALLEEPAPAGCEAVQDLYSWSLNFDAGRGPFAVFLDLIGWSEENIGEPIASRPAIGYLEASKLGAALTEYAEHPHEVYAYAETLINAESQS